MSQDPQMVKKGGGPNRRGEAYTIESAQKGTMFENNIENSKEKKKNRHKHHLLTGFA